MNEENYRPVSVLPSLSKVFERIIHNQLCSYFDSIFNPFLAAFRKGFGCQTTRLRLLKDWRQALNRNRYVGAKEMDLSKAFECLLMDCWWRSCGHMDLIVHHKILSAGTSATGSNGLVCRGPIPVPGSSWLRE